MASAEQLKALLRSAALLMCTPAMAATQQVVPISTEPPICEVVLEEDAQPRSIRRPGHNRGSGDNHPR